MQEEAPTCRSGDRTLTLTQIRQNGARAASGFRAAGLKADDAIAIMLRNDFTYLEASIGAGMTGVYTVSINWHFKGDEVRYILEDCGAKLLVIHADLYRQCVDSIPDSVFVIAVESPPEIVSAYAIRPDDAALPVGVTDWESWRNTFEPLTEGLTSPRGNIGYTSGTTGKPKGVRRNPLEGERQKQVSTLVKEWFNIEPGMRTVITGPLYHSVINTYTMTSLRVDSTIVLSPRFDAEDLLRIIDRERITHLHLVPTMFIRLLKLPEEVRAKYDHSSLQMVVHGAAPCPMEVKRQMIEWWGPIVFEYYGATEFGMASRSDSHEWLAKPGTTGKAWPGRVIEIHDDEGRQLPPDEVGEVYVNLGPLADFTYHNQAGQRADVGRRGLVTAGDAGYLDEDGYLFLTDRKRDMIISGGVNIYPAEIEAEIALHDKIVDSAVFSIPDDEFGETVVAAIELLPDESASEDEIGAFLKERLANYKIPRKIFFKEKLPRDDAGKIRKRELRDPFWQDVDRRI